MVKNIKKSIKYFIIFFGVILLVPTVMYLLIQNSDVQTFLVKRITRHLSAEIKSTITFGKLEYKFFNRLAISDILIKDKNNDTLIFSERVTVGIRRLDFRSKSFRLGRVIIMKPEISFISDSTGQLNLSWYLEMLQKDSDSTKKHDTKFLIDQIDISNATFSLSNAYKSQNKAKIDLSNFSLKGLNGIVEDFRIINDTTSFNIYNLSFKESSGFTVKKLNSKVQLAKQNILFSELNLSCDSSIINLSSFSLEPDSSSSFRNFTSEVRLNILLENSLISSNDLNYFIPISDSVDESVWLSGRVYGTISELRGRNIDLRYRDFTHLSCDFDFSGLPDIDNTFLYIGVNNLSANAKDLALFKLPEKGNIDIPPALYKLGTVTFDGSFSGFTTDFVTYGKFRTDQGFLQTDISVRPEESGSYKISGLVIGRNINLGELTGNNEFFGKLSMQTNIDGYAYSFEKFAAELTGKIDSIEVNQYKYRNIDLNGFFTEKTWDGSVKIIDDNLKMDLLGMFNFSEELPVFDFTLNISKADLYKLNFDKSDTTAALTILLTSNFKGNNIDNLDGEIKLLNSNLRKYGEVLELYDFSIQTFNENNQPGLSLRTDFVDADIHGHYNFATIKLLLDKTLSELMPSQYPPPDQISEGDNNNFTFEIDFKNTDRINEFFRSGILLADKSYINGSIFTDSIIKIAGSARYLTIKNNTFNDFSIDANIKASELNLDITSSSLILLKQSEQKAFSIGLKTEPDNFIFSVDWDNEDNIKNKGTFIARGSLTKNLVDTEKSILKVEIDSSEIYSKDNLWRISHASIRVDTSSISVDNVLINNKDRFYKVDGTVSKNPEDTLYVEFNDIDIAPINLLINQKNSDDPTSIPLDMNGQIRGKVLIADIYKNPLVEGDIYVTNFNMLGSDYGTLSINAELDVDKKVVNLNASNDLLGVKNLDISGYYDPEIKRIDITSNATKLPIDALNPLLRVFASDIHGLASGKVNLSGYPNNLVLNGAVMVEDATMKIDYLQTSFRLNDTIRFNNRGIKFDNVKLIDEKGSSATLSGIVSHKSFKDFGSDLVINMNPAECLVLNTKPKDNELFYGTAYATGVTTIKSGTNTLSFDISAKTGKNTKFFIPLNTGLSVSEYSFITFIDPNNTDASDEADNKMMMIPTIPKQSGMDMNFDLEVTPDAEVQLIFDSKVGDVMKGHGSGKLNINLDQKGNFKISGDYIIEDGDYLFTLGNILNKPFSVENGGKILFNGDIDNAEIDIKAIYKVKASLDPLFPEEGYTERIPIECQLNLSGKLFNPLVGFNIYLPTADEKTRTNLRNIISTDEELSRQFLYLLVMNSFYYESSTTATGTSAMAVTTTEMLSNQLSNWLSQISNDFDIGFKYSPGNKDLNSQEVQVALSTQLLNDKVVLNSNLDVRGTGNNAGNTNQITGDFDAEVKLTEKIRFKVFNRFNNPYTGKLAPYTQGIGIFFKEDFDKFSDLFNKKKNADMKKEEETSIEQKQN